MGPVNSAQDRQLETQMLHAMSKSLSKRRLGFSFPRIKSEQVLVDVQFRMKIKLMKNNF